MGLEPDNSEGDTKTSKIAVLEGEAKQIDLGWQYTTEDIVLLISGLSDLETTGGGFLGIGSFHNLDIALDRKTEAIVLMDIDREIVDLNLRILQIVENTERLEDLLPNIRKFIQEQDVMPIEFFDKYISTGTHLRCRIPLSWAKNPESFARLKQLINDGKIAVAHSDITDSSSMKVIGDFFSQSNSHLQYVNLSNIENPGHNLDDHELRELMNIPQSLQQAGGESGTLVITSFSTEGKIPASHRDRITVLKPKTEPIPKSGSIFSFEFKYLIRTLENFSKDGPMNAPEKD